MTPETAEILAINALGWLVGDPDGLERFLKQSGIDGAALREAAGSPEMGVAILDFLLAHEDLLLRYSDDSDVEPKTLHLARYRLGGETL